MPYRRLIARLDIKGDKVIKGIQMDGLRVLGNVVDFATRYYLQEIDEIVMLDAVATLHGQENIAKLITELTVDCFIPITVGGGIRTLVDADQLFHAGADKISINSAAIINPGLITEIAEKYGSQAVVVHIEAKKISDHRWECYTQSGRDPSGLRVEEWIDVAQNAGAGEFLISSVDKDGTQKGQDIDLAKLCTTTANVPVIFGSGVGKVDDVVETLLSTNVDGVVIGTALHREKFELQFLKNECRKNGINVRSNNQTWIK